MAGCSAVRAATGEPCQRPVYPGRSWCTQHDPANADRHCTATSKQTGKRCGSYPVEGATVCKHHGGNLPQVRRAAQARRVEADARRTLGALTHQAVENPLTELAKLAGEVKAWKELCAKKVADLTSLTTGDDSTRARGGGQADADRVHAEIVLFERALDRCTQVLTAIARLNIDDRLARIDQTVAAAVLDALNTGLGEIGVVGEQAAQARQAASRQLRAVTTGDVPA